MNGIDSGTTIKPYHICWKVICKQSINLHTHKNLIAPLGKLCVNVSVCQVENMIELNVVLVNFEEKINLVDPQRLKLYIQVVKDIEK